MAKGLETKGKIVDVALGLFQARGFHKVSLPEIGKAVGISHAAIYEYFSDKDALLAACIRYAIDRTRGQIDATIGVNDPADKKLKGYIVANIRAAHHDRAAVGQLLSLYFYAAYNPQIRTAHLEIVAASTARVESHVIQGNREGAWSVKDPGPRARMIHDLLLGEVFKAHHDPSDMAEKKRAELVWKTARRILA
jgi:AcrR family transcriptional regulator